MNAVQMSREHLVSAEAQFVRGLLETSKPSLRERWNKNKDLQKD